MYVEPSSFFEQLFCLLSFTIHVLESVNQVKIEANVTSTGACPPDHILSWKADAPHWLNVSLKYTVFCCGTNKEEFCMSPKRYKKQLKFLKCCEKRISRSEEVPRCNITTALQRLHIFNPYHTPQPEVSFYSGFEITADGKNDTWYSSKYFYLGLEQTICTKPSKFYVTVDKANVTFVWGMPPRMSCTSFRFHLRYSIVRDDCSDDSNQSETGEVETRPYNPDQSRQKTFTRVDSVDSLLKSYRDYLFKLTCDVYSETESAAASVLVKRHSRVPRVVPRDLLVQKQNNFEKKRNVTLTWKAPSASCPAGWNGKPVKFLLQYLQTQNSSSHAIAPTSESDVTSVNIDPNASSVVISNLSRFQEYAVTLAMCTDAGCGPNRSTIIKSEPDPPARRVKIRRSEGTQPWIIVLIALLLSGAVVAVGIVSLVVTLRMKHSRKLNDSENSAHPPLSERFSISGPYDSYTTSAKPLTQDDGDYDDSSRRLLDDSESSTNTLQWQDTSQ